MNTNEDIRNDTSEDVIELGVASIETQGNPSTNSAEVYGDYPSTGIAEQ